MSTEHTLRLIGEYLTQGGYAPGIDAETLDREAVLIAAAPDMLAACEAVLAEFPALDGKRIERVKAICRAAIAKATGEVS